LVDQVFLYLAIHFSFG